MIENKPSRTAQGAAMHRAFHQIKEHPPVFTDPLALRIVGAEAADTLQRRTDWHANRQAQTRRAFMAARSRYAEDQFAQTYARGVRQYVVLGAGLDTFAYRAPYSDVRVFEVDHPATQGWKRARLSETGIAIPQHVSYAPVDFERETIIDGLARAQIDFTQPVFFAWLGVTMYLDEETILGTLRMIAAKTASGSEIVFDFSVVPKDREARGRFAERVAQMGEPLKSSFDPTDLQDKVRGCGFGEVELRDHRALNALYFTDRSDDFKLRGGQMIRARV